MPAQRVHALVRNAKAAQGLASLGVTTHVGDYDEPQTLDAAFAGIDRVLLISSNDLGGRLVQHGNVIEAAKRAGVGLVAYTSLLHADTSPISNIVASENETAGCSSYIPIWLAVPAPVDQN